VRAGRVLDQAFPVKVSERSDLVFQSAFVKVVPSELLFPSDQSDTVETNMTPAPAALKVVTLAIVLFGVSALSPVPAEATFGAQAVKSV
jgi:hypothetical protein